MSQSFPTKRCKQMIRSGWWRVTSFGLSSGLRIVLRGRNTTLVTGLEGRRTDRTWDDCRRDWMGLQRAGWARSRPPPSSAASLVEGAGE